MAWRHLINPRGGRLLKAALAASAALGGTVATAGPAQAIAVPSPGRYYQIFAAAVGDPNSRQCLDVPDGTKQAAAQVQTYHCHDNDAQRWEFIPTGVDNTYLIQNKASGLCLYDLDPDDILQNSCKVDFPTEWKLLPSLWDGQGTQIWNGEWAWCTTVTSATDHAHPRLSQCSNSPSGDDLSRAQDWHLT